MEKLKKELGKKIAAGKRLAKKLRQLSDGRICLVCKKEVPHAGGIYHTDLCVLTCQGGCSELLKDQQKKCYSKLQLAEIFFGSEEIDRIVRGVEVGLADIAARRA